VRTPVQTSMAKGPTAAIASAAFSGVMPPARGHHRFIDGARPRDVDDGHDPDPGQHLPPREASALYWILAGVGCPKRIRRCFNAHSGSPSFSFAHVSLGKKTKGGHMADMLKVIEVLAESEKSWEDAAAEAVKRAAKTLKNIRSIYIENFEAKVEGNRVVRYRVNGKISFVLE
jgi:hypothetical protein